MLVFWGDSIWAGPPGNGYVPAMISHLVDADVRHAAIAGSATHETVQRMADNPHLRQGIALISMGRCNYQDGTERIMSDWRRGIELLGHDRWFSVPLPHSMRRGTTCFSLCKEINEQLRDLAGDRFIDTQAYLIEHGLGDAGITPTARDLRDIEGGIIPASLRCDPIHCNRIGNTLTARFIADVLIERQLVPARISPLAA